MVAAGAPVLIDGSYGEGGGALLRTCIILAALTQQPFRISNIRGATKYPNLNFEDLTLIGLVAKVCEAETIGLSLGASEISFLPTKRPRALKSQGQNLELGIEQYSQCPAIIFSAILPLLARSGGYSTLSLEGESYGNGILGFDAFQHSTLRALKRLGIYATTDLIRAGFGRGSSGQVDLEVEPSAVTGIDWSSRGKLLRLEAHIATSGLSESVAARGMDHLKNLAHHSSLDLKSVAHEVSSHQLGANVTVCAEFENGFGSASALGRKGVRIESVAQAAFEQCAQYMASNTSVDPFLADQLIVSAAIAEGETSFTVQTLTQRLLTTIWVIKQFLPIRITVKGHEGEPGAITVRR